MAELSNAGKVFETDILIIGGGPSGLWAANRAKQLGSEVLVVDKD
jgi:flavin-dependent dehydrogenase